MKIVLAQFMSFFPSVSVLYFGLGEGRNKSMLKNLEMNLYNVNIPTGNQLVSGCRGWKLEMLRHRYAMYLEPSQRFMLTENPSNIDCWEISCWEGEAYFITL